MLYFSFNSGVLRLGRILFFTEEKSHNPNAPITEINGPLKEFSWATNR